jgi:hypothetical protein
VRLADDEQWNVWRADIDRIYRETVYAFKKRLVYREMHERLAHSNQ